MSDNTIALTGEYNQNPICQIYEKNKQNPNVGSIPFSKIYMSSIYELWIFEFNIYNSILREIYCWIQPLFYLLSKW